LIIGWNWGLPQLVNVDWAEEAWKLGESERSSRESASRGMNCLTGLCEVGRKGTRFGWGPCLNLSWGLFVNMHWRDWLREPAADIRPLLCKDWLWQEGDLTDSTGGMLLRPVENREQVKGGTTCF
jgi:hypothetical protein